MVKGSDPPLDEETPCEQWCTEDPEFSRHGYSSRVGRKRADVNHLWIDPILVGGPWLLAGAGAATAVGAVVRRLRK